MLCFSCDFFSFVRVNDFKCESMFCHTVWAFLVNAHITTVYYTIHSGSLLLFMHFSSFNWTSGFFLFSFLVVLFDFTRVMRPVFSFMILFMCGYYFDGHFDFISNVFPLYHYIRHTNWVLHSPVAEIIRNRRRNNERRRNINNNNNKHAKYHFKFNHLFSWYFMFSHTPAPLPLLHLFFLL